MYATTTKASRMKNGPVQGARVEIRRQKVENGSTVNSAIPSAVKSMTGASARFDEGQFRLSGHVDNQFCVHMEMTIQPAWRWR